MGFFLFDRCGRAILRSLSGMERILRKLLRWPRAAAVISAYFAVWFAISAPLQMQTRFDNWSRTPLLLIGNDASVEYGVAWEGDVYSLQIWNRQLDSAAAQALTSETDLRLGPSGLLAAYDFSTPPPSRDQMNFLPELYWVSNGHAANLQLSAARAGVSLGDRSWLSSGIPVTNLVRELQKTSQLAVRVVCRPESASGMAAAIVSLSQRSGVADWEVVQDDAKLVFMLRNPISTNRYVLRWVIGNVFSAHQTRDILFSYDGNSAALYLDGLLRNRTGWGQESLWRVTSGI